MSIQKRVRGVLMDVATDNDLGEYDPDTIDQATADIRELIKSAAKIEKDKWKDHKDKFGIGVHAGIEALECVLTEGER